MTSPPDRLSPHFRLNELTRSATALRHGIENRPGPEEVRNLTRLAEHILEPVRRHFAIPFSPSSGYRSARLNQLIGSQPTSQHIRGQAVDFAIPGLDNEQVAAWIKRHLTFDQLILEYHCPDEPKSGWIHCSYRIDHNRQESLIFDGVDYRDF